MSCCSCSSSHDAVVISSPFLVVVVTCDILCFRCCCSVGRLSVVLSSIVLCCFTVLPFVVSLRTSLFASLCVCAPCSHRDPFGLCFVFFCSAGERHCVDIAS